MKILNTMTEKVVISAGCFLVTGFCEVLIKHGFAVARKHNAEAVIEKLQDEES